MFTKFSLFKKNKTEQKPIESNLKELSLQKQEIHDQEVICNSLYYKAFPKNKDNCKPVSSSFDENFNVMNYLNKLIDQDITKINKHFTATTHFDSIEYSRIGNNLVEKDRSISYEIRYYVIHILAQLGNVSDMEHFLPFIKDLDKVMREKRSEDVEEGDILKDESDIVTYRTALDIASENENQKMMHLLRIHGALTYEEYKSGIPAYKNMMM